MTTHVWHNCYGHAWGNSMLCTDAFAHPAKFSRELVRRIFDHGITEGWWDDGSVIGDPFAGVGCGGVIAAYAGLRWIGVELEAKFVETAEKSFEMHRRKWDALGCPQPVIIQGDSRDFAALVSQCDAAVMSPPYAETLAHGQGRSLHDRNLDAMRNGYGKRPGQIGQDRGESYWTAVTRVYGECRRALKHGGVLVVVVKSYVKNREIVPLPDQTSELLERLGFEPVERIRAMLVKEDRSPGLFGDDVVEMTEQKSFFRRLCESKGSPRIDWEDVLMMKKEDDDDEYHSGPRIPD